MDKKKNKILGISLLIIYLAFLVYILFFSAAYGRFTGEATQYSKYNIQIGGTISRYYLAAVNGDISFLVFLENILGNILLFIPLHPLIYLIRGKVFRVYSAQLLAILFPLILESVQYKFGLGVFDIDDILLNSIGIFIGWVITVNKEKASQEK